MLKKNKTGREEPKKDLPKGEVKVTSSGSSRLMTMTLFDVTDDQ